MTSHERLRSYPRLVDRDKTAARASAVPASSPADRERRARRRTGSSVSRSPGTTRCGARVLVPLPGQSAHWTAPGRSAQRSRPPRLPCRPGFNEGVSRPLSTFLGPWSVWTAPCMIGSPLLRPSTAASRGRTGPECALRLELSRTTVVGASGRSRTRAARQPPGPWHLGGRPDAPPAPATWPFSGELYSGLGAGEGDLIELSPRPARRRPRVVGRGGSSGTSGEALAHDVHGVGLPPGRPAGAARADRRAALGRGAAHRGRGDPDHHGRPAGDRARGDAPRRGRARPCWSRR